MVANGQLEVLIGTVTLNLGWLILCYKRTSSLEKLTKPTFLVHASYEEITPFLMSPKAS